MEFNSAALTYTKSSRATKPTFTTPKALAMALRLPLQLTPLRLHLTRRELQLS